MKLQKVDAGVWVKAIEKNIITNPAEGEYIHLKVNGNPDTGFYRDDKGMYDTNFHGLQSLEEVEWLKPYKDVIVLTEDELQEILKEYLNTNIRDFLDKKELTKTGQFIQSITETPIT